jgi:hypothetical protein
LQFTQPSHVWGYFVSVLIPRSRYTSKISRKTERQEEKNILKNKSKHPLAKKRFFLMSLVHKEVSSSALYPLPREILNELKDDA